jgi:hyperosmotically inducible periplasmic protein
MKLRRELRMALALWVAAGPLHAQTSPRIKNGKPDESVAQAVQHQLLLLPYYSVFDYLAFTMEGDKVTLSGQVLRPTLKSDAEAAVKSIEGVGIVVNAIEVLPKSSADDELRRQVYRVIYEDGELARYAVQPVPSIHIIVKNGAVTLEGFVYNEDDRKLADKKAGSLANGQSLTNHMAVRAKESTAK